MGVATGCGCKGVIDFFILLILYLFFFSAASLYTFCSLKKMFFVLKHY